MPFTFFDKFRTHHGPNVCLLLNPRDSFRVVEMPRTAGFSGTTEICIGHTVKNPKLVAYAATLVTPLIFVLYQIWPLFQKVWTPLLYGEVIGQNNQVSPTLQLEKEVGVVYFIRKLSNKPLYFSVNS